jgi:hypothetical protein
VKEMGRLTVIEIGERDGEPERLRKCFICGQMELSSDKEPPFRCDGCYAAVMANEADGEL